MSGGVKCRALIQLFPHAGSHPFILPQLSPVACGPEHLLASFENEDSAVLTDSRASDWFGRTLIQGTSLLTWEKARWLSCRFSALWLEPWCPFRVGDGTLPTRWEGPEGGSVFTML